MPLCPKDTTSMRAADPLSKMDKDDESRQGDGKMLSTLRQGNGADPVTGTGGLEHLMPQGVAREATSAEMAYKEPKESLIDLLLKLQSGDTSTQQQIQQLSEGHIRDTGSMQDIYTEWRVDSNGLL